MKNVPFPWYTIYPAYFGAFNKHRGHFLCIKIQNDRRLKYSLDTSFSNTTYSSSFILRMPNKRLPVAQWLFWHSCRYPWHT